MASAEKSDTPTRKGGRGRKIVLWTLLILAVLVVAVLVLAPMLVPGIVKDQLVANLKDRVRGKVDVKDVSFSWPAKVVLKDLTIDDDLGQRVASVGEVRVEAALFKAIGGNFDADIVVDAPVVVVREEADGTLNLARVFGGDRTPAAPTSGGSSAPATAAKPEKPVELPKVRASFKVQNGRASFVARTNERTEIDRFEASAGVDDLDRPIRFAAEVKTRQGAAVKVDGEITVGKDSKLRMDLASGKVSYKVERVDLAEFKPVASAFAAIERLAGTLQGSGDYVMSSPTAVSGKGGLRLDGLAVAGPAVGADPVSVKFVDLKSDVVVEGAGTARPTLEIAVEDFLTAKFQGTIAKSEGTKETTTSGRLDVRADLAGLSRSAGSLLKLKPGYRLAGTATIGSDLAMLLGSEGLQTGRTEAKVRVAGLQVFDAAGRQVPIDPELSIDLAAAKDASGVLKLDQADVRMGRTSLAAKGGYDTTKRALSESFVKADADLDDLAAKLASFTDLPIGFGGKLTVDAKVTAEGSAARAESKVKVAGFRLTNVGGKNLGPLNLDLDQAGVVDLRPGATSTLDRFVLSSGPLVVDAKGSGKDVGDEAKMAATFDVTLTADPAALQAQLGDFLAGIGLSGQPIRVASRGRYEDGRAQFQGQMDAPNLVVRTEGFGPAGLAVQGGGVRFDGGYDTKSGDLDLAVAEAKAQSMTAGMKDGRPPVTITNLLLAVAAKKQGDALDLSSLKLDSNVAKGDGQAKIRQLMKEGMSADGRIRIDGEVAPIVDLARGFVPSLAAASGSGRFAIDLVSTTSGKEIALKQEVRVTGLNLNGVKVGEKPASVQNADIALTSDVVVDNSGSGVATVRSLGLTAPGVGITGKGTTRGFLGAAATPENAYQLQGSLIPDEITRRLSAFLAGYELAGAKVDFDVDVAAGKTRSTAKGKLTAPDLRISMPPDPAKPATGPRVITQNDLAAEFDIVSDTTPGREVLEIRPTRYRSRTATASVEGRLSGPGNENADVTLVADAELENVVRDLGALLSLGDYRLKGATRIDGRMSGKDGELKMVGKTTVNNLVVETAAENGQRTTVSEPAVVLDVDLASSSKSSSVLLNTVKLDASFLRGTLGGRMLNLKTEPEFQNVKGEFSYHPEKLSAVLKPWMPGPMRGTELQKISFTLQGKARETDWISVLRGSTGNGAIGLAPLAMAGYDIEGKVDTDIRDEHVKTTTALKMNGGDLKIDSNLDLRPREDAVSTVKLTLNRGAANAQMSPLLGLLSPLLAVSQAVGGGAGGTIQGLIDANLDLSYNGAFTKETTSGGWDAFPKQRLNGKGRVALNDLAVQGSNFIGEAVRLLGIGDPGRLAVDPLEFTLRDGRVIYDRALNLAMGDFRSAMNGSIGLDKSLDLLWEIPVTDQLVSKYAFLRFWKGGAIQVPVRGTSDSPAIKFEETLGNLAKQAVEKELKEKAGNLLGGNNPLGGILGGGNKPPGGGQTPPPGGGQAPPPGGGQTPPPAGGNNPLGGILPGILGGGQKQPPAPTPVPKPAPVPPPNPAGGGQPPAGGGTPPAGGGAPPTTQPPAPTPPAPVPPPGAQRQGTAPTPVPVPPPAGGGQPPAGTQPAPATPPPPGAQPAPAPAPAPAPNPLGGVLGGILGGGEAEKKAQDLLNKADAFWNQNRKAEAVPLYRELKDKHANTDAYKKAKERILARQSG